MANEELDGCGEGGRARVWREGTRCRGQDRQRGDPLRRPLMGRVGEAGVQSGGRVLC